MKSGKSHTETLLSVVVIVCLVGIAAGVFVKQFYYDEETFSLSLGQKGIETGAAETTPAEEDTQKGFTKFLPEGYEPMSPPEQFDSETLSQKINGKADLYLEYGFVNLDVQRFVNSSNDEEWFEFFLYEMEAPPGAFAVYSNQRRAGQEDIEITRFAYETENALFFCHGKYYIEEIAAQPSPGLINVMTEMGNNFVEEYPVEPYEPDELDLLPQEGRRTGSIKLYLRNAFGYESFDMIFAATYTVDDEDVTGFISIRESPEAARTLAEKYMDFLINYGGEETTLDTDIEGLRAVDLIGAYELVFSQGNVLAGIHGAMDKAAAITLAERIAAAISEKQ